MNDDVIKLLLIEDEVFDVERVKRTLHPFREKIKIMDEASSGLAALECIEKNPGRYDVVIMDYQLSGGLFGEALIRQMKKVDPTLQIVIITKMTVNQTDLLFATNLLESGANWFCTKYPVDIEEHIYQPTDFLLSIMNSYEKKNLQLERNHSQNKLDRNIQSQIDRSPLVGASEGMTELKENIARYAAINANVLILGESGTGKELVARNIHYQSPRKYENFVTVNCAAIPKELIESELFGFEKGSFTGAASEKPGLFEQAHGGTILLDEIGELPMNVQAKLLRVLQEGEIDKIGRKQRYKVDVRVVASTNRDLDALMSQNRFREDLYYRLNIIQIKVPPLRERREDIPLLIHHFLGHYSRDFGMVSPAVSKPAMERLVNYRWPGNIRQLRNVAQRLLVISAGEITDTHVKTTLQDRPEEFIPPVMTSDQVVPLKLMEREFKTKYVRFVRKHCSSDAEAAQKLGLAPPNFHRLCKELGLK